jgi:ubiquinone/menaquinone biosynthesis C-methylase UbiE
MTDKNPEVNLQSRHQREEQYHDQKNLCKIKTPSHYKFHPTYKVVQKMKASLNLNGNKKVLECGCGSGWLTVEIAQTGAIVSAFDISGEAVHKTLDVLRKQRLGNCEIQKMAAENLQYADDYFDYVIGFAILHHLDLAVSMPEVFRVLKPGGTAVFAEPLGSNPLINAYRSLTPQFRTPDEKPLHLKAFQKALKGFVNFEHQEFFLTALLPIALSYVPFTGKLIDPMVSCCMKLDAKILSRVPALGNYAWYTVMKLSKPLREEG